MSMAQPNANMTSSKPYLLRALYEWIMDNQKTPHIVVNINVSNIKVPLQYAQNGQIILNISSSAALNLQLNDDFITFSARFSGTPMNVVVPISAVLAIYAKETGAGMVFEQGEDNSENPPPTSNKPHLKLV
jgi:stringent starvation protein B